ncbi:MAG: ABC transporter ATP-binding protein [Lachnospiraceae bacterium]
MKTWLSNYTCGNARELIAPTIWAFLENLCSMMPAFLGMLALGTLLEPLMLSSAQVDIDRLWVCCIGMAAAFLLQSIISILAYRYSYYASQRSSAKLRTEIAAKIGRLPLGFYAGKESGELSNTFVTDPDSLEQSVSFFIPQILSMGALSIFSCIMLLFYNWQLAMAMYLALPVCLVIMRFAIRLRHRQSERVRTAKAAATTFLHEYLLGMRNLKSYNQTGTGFGKLDASYATLARESTREEGFPGALTLLAAHGIQFGIPLIIFAASMLLVQGTVEIFILLAFLILATRLYGPLSTAITCIIMLRVSSVASTRINTLLSEEEQSGTAGAFPSGSIQFEDVSFSYGTKNVIEHVSFTAPQNRLTALVGPSGSGKSTLLRLACRFWDVHSGNITLGGTPLSTLSPQSLYEQVSMVFQENYLFGDSIRNNLLFADNSISDERIIRACQKARCHEFIMALPEQYDTVIGEGGATLSGGERQRLAIARAILKDAPVLFLDEPTSSLDAENELLVQQAIGELVKDKTVIMIAHRLKTIADADHIVVLDQGHVVQAGTHKELLSQTEGLYTHLWELQTQAQLWNI